MFPNVRFALSVCLVLFGAAGASTASAQDEPLWRFDAAAPALRALSCPAETEETFFAPLSASVQPVPLGSEADVAAQLPDGIAFAGGWEIDASDRTFGGLSGLAMQPDGDLLAVGDTGRFVRIGMTNGVPNGTVSSAPMRFENPLIRPGKLTADAEGLAVRDGLALVSFERHFRILAFDLGGCGAAAIGTTVAKPPPRFGTHRVRANAGPEALQLDPQGKLSVTYEQLRDGQAVTGSVMANGSLRLSESGPVVETDHRPVGADTLLRADGRTVTARLYRAYDRARGNRVRLDIADADSDPYLTLRLVPPLATDNFEGVALSETDGKLRAYILSDDNFSDRQRTLLYAFDLASTSPD